MQRRRRLYRSFAEAADLERYLRLRSIGLPALVSYFLCDATNMMRTKAHMHQLSASGDQDAHAVLQQLEAMS